MSTTSRTEDCELTECMSRFADAIIGNHGFLPVGALIASERQRPLTKQAKDEDIYRMFIEPGIKMDRNPVSLAREDIDRQLTDTYGKKKTFQAYSIHQW